MAAVNFDNLFSTLLNGVKDIAKQSVKDYIDDGVSNGISILYELKPKLELWAIQLAEGQLSKDDFEWSLQSAMDLVAMVALKQAGLAQIQLDKFKNDLTNLIVNTLETVIP